MSEPKLTKFALGGSSQSTQTSTKLLSLAVRPLGTSFRYPVSDYCGHNEDFGKPTMSHNPLYRGPKTVSVKRRAKSSGKD